MGANHFNHCIVHRGKHTCLVRNTAWEVIPLLTYNSHVIRASLRQIQALEPHVGVFTDKVHVSHAKCCLGLLGPQQHVQTVHVFRWDGGLVRLAEADVVQQDWECGLKLRPHELNVGDRVYILGHFHLGSYIEKAGRRKVCFICI